MNHQKKEVREDFCPSCLVMPLAFVGVSASAGSMVAGKKHKTWKKALLVSGAVTILSAIGLLVYYSGGRKCTDGSCSM